MAVVDDTTTAYLDLRGVLDAGKEVQKLQKKRAEVRTKLLSLCLASVLDLHIRVTWDADEEDWVSQGRRNVSAPLAVGTYSRVS